MKLPEHTSNQSLRVFYYGEKRGTVAAATHIDSRWTGMAISSKQFPERRFSPETWLLTCRFHDIGTMDKHDTFMSFEFYGGILALDDITHDDGSGRLKLVCMQIPWISIRPCSPGYHQRRGEVQLLLDQDCEEKFHHDVVHDALMEPYDRLIDIGVTRL
ncbi:uncharacterized protein Z518_02517 [Rhinocladiella mackenziei CBS 650.93]|uniref:Rhinocladiella mackenziei CBS 650.93 unplaced genomic scaffold supercont1.2, whole genome shotgun sequence n=1 Tax=Rhinocladiella mackenziei CBS 650.93 TaxID=1442369 RepID=A0A0D2HBP8_9EURO|nr:uncharacterized protein Z518_02517 [Rhinocladiella mackenziei CBS 650.93]KIX07863.1 hypothetical protein Z518_02517 [Rhinocladiella mackenziei CBS 650.93]